MKALNIIYSIITASISSYFLNVLLTYKEENILVTFASVFIFPGLIGILLVYISFKFKIENIGIEAKKILIITSFLLICYSIMGLIYTIYFREYGPWTTRMDAMWLNRSEAKNVLDFPVGIFGLLATLNTWLFLQINSNKQIKSIGYFSFAIIILLIFLANNKTPTFNY
jgi:hypothetical protein